MATEAFALSPMSARAAEPNEQDYDAIREAFMETARGRWFLGEYARRNRNADTSMVLNAVARIEEALAAQRQPLVEDRLPEALVAIRRAIREAETIAIAAFDPAAIEASLGPVQRGVRIIREISWRWREIGADGRICDLIDSQLAAIDSACGQISTIDPRTELKAAFDLLRDRIEEAETGEAAAPKTDATARPAPAAAPDAAAAEDVGGAAEMASLSAVEEPTAMTRNEAFAAEAEAPQQEIADAAEAEAVATTANVAEAIDVADAMAAAAQPEAVEAAEDHVAAEAEIAEVVETADGLSVDAMAEAEDEAVLEMVAFEMGAPDPQFDEPPLEEVTAEIAEPIAAEIEAPVAAGLAEPIAAESIVPAAAAMASADAAVAVMERPVAEAVHVSPLPTHSPAPEQPSLGATILASGLLQRPRPAANDPLAPIRRMTQAEKIAFFS